MELSNYHIHSKYCDGKGEPEDYIEVALNSNIQYLGFSSHAPLPFDTLWTMNIDDLDRYLNCINCLKKKYQGKIDIFLGLEVDYIPDLISPNCGLIKNLGLDYRIGSVHYLNQFENGDYWPADGSGGDFQKGLQEIFDNNIKKAVETYFTTLSNMVLHHPPEIIGHFDVIKKNNQGNCYFSEQERWYQDLVKRCLHIISKSNCIVEVNTGGIIRKRIDALYPSEWILHECLKLNIPVTVNSDAHKADQVNGYLIESIRILKDIGFREIRRLTGDGWVKYDL